MILDLKDVLVTPEGVAEFSFPLDLADFTLHGNKPITTAVAVEGNVTNHGGALVLEGHCVGELSLQCDRCLKEYKAQKIVNLNSLVADHLEDEENDEILLLEGTCLDLEQVASVAFILELDTKSLCSDQCEGLCPSCGVNLNEEDCRCNAVVDSPFAKLAQLLEE